MKMKIQLLCFYIASVCAFVDFWAVIVYNSVVEIYQGGCAYAGEASIKIQ